MNAIVVWLRQDLRVTDNPALYQAAKHAAVLPIYILDDDNAGEFRMGAASRWWLHHSLHSLNRSLRGKLSVYRGDALKLIPRIARENDARAVYWNRCYEPWRTVRDQVIEERLTALGVECHHFNGALLWEPEDVLKDDGTPYRVFTPFYRKGCLTAAAPREPLPSPERLTLVSAEDERATSIEALDLPPTIRWDEEMTTCWNVGEDGARRALDQFLSGGLPGYREGRDFPARPNVSRLSPHLHFGEISPHQVWYAALERYPDDGDLDCFRSELGWREFSYHLLRHFPELPRKNWQRKFDAFPWRNAPAKLRRWQRGETGYPLVDAGMRELWRTGYMHNRLRMVTGSFLVKNLLLHWRHGEAWFWDCLVDADLANNSAGWQWIAGCGADAAPYFRVFNPVTQGKKFDPTGDYTRRFVPELARLPDKYLFAPWEAPANVLKEAGVTLGKNYPRPVVGLKASRERALNAFASVRNVG